MKKMGVGLFLLVGFSFLFSACTTSKELSFNLEALHIRTWDILLTDLWEQRRELGDFEWGVENGFPYQHYEISIPKYHFKHTFSYPTPKAIKEYGYPALENRQWIQSWAIVLPPSYTQAYIGHYPNRIRPFPYEAKGEVMLWIYSLPDADENTSLLEIGRATTNILKEFFQAESLTAIGSRSQKAHEDTLEWLKECKAENGERHECKDYERRLKERAYLNGSGEISHFNCQHPTTFQNDEIYGFWFQRCIGALSNKECNERRLPRF